MRPQFAGTINADILEMYKNGPIKSSKYLCKNKPGRVWNMTPK